MRRKSSHVDAIVPRRGERECRTLRAELGKALNSEPRGDREHQCVILRKRTEGTKAANVTPTADAARFKDRAAKTCRDKQRDLNIAVEDRIYGVGAASAGPGGELGAVRRPSPELCADPAANTMKVGDPPVSHQVQRDRAIEPRFGRGSL